MKTVFSVLNDTGKRNVNENSYYCNPDSSLFIIADGMGGRGYGDEASGSVIKSFTSFIEHASGDSEATMIVKRKPGISTEQVYLVNGLNFANTELIKLSKSTSKYPNMACSVGSIIVRSRYISMAGLGNIRIYVYRAGKLKKISTEQTLSSSVLMENPRPEQDIPISFLGVEDSLSNIFCRDERIKEDDFVIMMTASISKYLTEKEMSLIMEEYSQNLDRVNKELISRSRLKGNKDNSTVISLSTKV